MANQGRKVYRTARGKQVDLDLLISRNELTPAVGNHRVNARGDELGQGGKIVRKREDVLKDYYQAQPGMRDETVLSSDTKITQAEQEEFEAFDEEPILEKPVEKININTGIYVLDSKIINFVPKNKIDMPDLLIQLKKLKKKIIIFPLFEQWSDLGLKKDLLAARKKKN